MEKTTTLQKIISVTFSSLFFSCFVGLSAPQANDTKGNTPTLLGENWNLKVKGLTVYNDNVVNSPKQRDLRPANLGRGDGDSSIDLGGTASYLYKPDNKIKVKFAYDLDVSIHTRLHAYDLLSQFFTVSPTYKISPLMNVNLQYSYIYNHLNLKPLSGIHYISPSFNHMSKDFGFTRLAYTYKSTNNLQYNSRDNEQHSAGIDHYYFFNNFKSHLKGSYKYTKDNTKGTAYKRKIHDVGVKLKMPLFYDIDLDAKVDLSFRKYDKRVSTSGDRLRSDYRKRYTINLSKVIMKNEGYVKKLSVVGRYQHTNNMTNLDVNEYSANLYQIGLQGEF